MAVQHRNLPDSEIHEPKGASTAVSNTVYVSDGSGSGVWKRLPATAIQGLNDGGTANRKLLTDGANGIKLVPDNVYGQLFYNYGGAVPHNTITYSAGAIANMVQNGQRLRMNYSGVYRVTFLGNTVDQGSSGDPLTPFRAFLTIDGTNPVGKITVTNPTVSAEAVISLSSNTEIWMVMPLTGGGVGQMYTSNGSLTVQLLSGV
ncbi:MAG: hypothetical protein [Podoviridae sp. ctbj_2]|nr:MAG: hypothetical protein [Podoviridae sp. ctbj_2]